MLTKLSGTSLKKLKEIRVSEGISVSQDVLGEEWESFEKLCL